MDEAVTKALEQATSLVTQAANKMAELAPDVWNMLVWQARAEGISTMVAALLILVIVFAVQQYVPTLWQQPEYKHGSWDNDAFYVHMGVMKVIPTGILVFVSLITVAEFRGAILKIINPNYYAIKFLLSMGGQ